MTNKKARIMICSIDDGYKGKHFTNKGLMHKVKHLITSDSIEPVSFFGVISLTGHQLGDNPRAA